MDQILNSPLQIVTLEQTDRWHWEVPSIFLRGCKEPAVTFILHSTFGGPWELQAMRNTDSGRYHFQGKAWRQFLDESLIEVGLPLLFSKVTDFQLHVFLFWVDGSGIDIKGYVPRVNDWVVTLKTSEVPHQLRGQDGTGGPPAGEAEMGHSGVNDLIEVSAALESSFVRHNVSNEGWLNEAFWQGEFRPHRRHKFVLDSGFCHRAQIIPGQVLILRNVATSQEWSVKVESSRGKFYLKEGLIDFIDGCEIEVGDNVTFKTGGEKPGLIAVAIDKKKPHRRHPNVNQDRPVGGATASRQEIAGDVAPPCAATNSNVGKRVVLPFRDSYRKFMNIPVPFAKEANLKGGDVARVLTNDGKIWEFTVTTTGKLIRLSKGWRAFVREIDLKPSIALVFTILDGSGGPQLSLSYERYSRKRRLGR